MIAAIPDVDAAIDQGTRVRLHPAAGLVIEVQPLECISRVTIALVETDNWGQEIQIGGLRLCTMTWIKLKYELKCKRIRMVMKNEGL